MIYVSKLIYSEFLLFADDLKLFRIIKSVEDCKLLQPNIDCAQKLSTENYMKLKMYRTNTIYLTRKTSRVNFNYLLGDLLIVRTDCIKYVFVKLDSRLHIHRHAYCLHSEAPKLLRLISFIRK
jgi:hypothetical protein